VNTRLVVIESFDDTPHLVERAIPELGADQVLIRVEAASLNAFDWKVADGFLKHAFEYEFPVTIGRDYAGVVVNAGPAVTRMSPGDAVFGFFTGQKLARGSYAEHVWVGEDECLVAKPEALSFVDAACLPLCGMVAFRCVEAVEPKEGETHVVIGAPGGAGSYAVQLLAARGARVLASGSPGDEAYLRDLGAAEVFDYRQGIVDAVRALAPDGVHGLLDLVSYKPEFMEHVRFLVPGGRAASLHRAADPELLDPLGVAGTNVGSFPDRELLLRIGAAAASGEFRVPVQETFALDEAPAALEKLKNEHARGKLALRMDGSK